MSEGVGWDRRLAGPLDLTSRHYEPSILRSLRAVEVLEDIASKDARQLLQSLAAGHPDAG